MTTESFSLPNSAAILHNIRILNPTTDTDDVGAALMIEGGLYPLTQEQLGSDMSLRALPLPESVIGTLTMDDIQPVDADGLVAGPGLVELYSHSGEPGFEARETAATLAQSALAGGFTRLALLPDTQPVLDTPGAIARLHRLFESLEQAPHIYVWGALTQGLNGTQMTELAELSDAANELLAGFAEGHALQDLTLVQRILDYAHPLERPIALYPRTDALADDGVAREGMIATQLGLPSQPTSAETTALSAIIEVVAETQTPVHIMRVSTARSVGLIQEAKEQGLPITASTTWMHVLLNSYALSQYDPNLRLEPPLGNPDDQSALILAVKAGILDAIAIEHTPYTYEEKTVPFAQAPPGVIGLQCSLPLLWQGLVEAGHLTGMELWRALSTNPAKCLGQTPPVLSSEFVLFQPEQEWLMSPESLHSLSANVPWIDQSVYGQVLHTSVRDRT